MSDAEPGTFDFASTEEPAEVTWTVAEVGEAIKVGLRRQFPGPLWIRGEIQGFRRPNRAGHCYFDLIEPGSGPGERPLATMSVSLFRNDRTRIEAALAQTTGGSGLTDGMEVRLRARVNWWVEGGRLNLVMSDIDPAFTVGQLGVRRRRLLAALAAEGLLERNGSIPVPVLPLRIGLVTSAGSAAHADFVHELTQSGYRFHIDLLDTRVQGAEAPAGVVAALATLSTREVDVIAVVRGGGSVTDLAAFDHEDIARAIAATPKPVITGIGHEIDRSVADEVAALSAKTPTAAAALLVGFVAAEDSRLAERMTALARRAEARLGAQERWIADRTRGVARAAHLVAARTGDGLEVRLDRLDRLARRDLASHRRGEVQRVERLARLAGARIDRARTATERLARQITEVGPRALSRNQRALETRATLLRAHDPATTLARGWSLTRGPDGNLLRDPTQVTSGDRIVTTLASGQLTSTVADPTPPS